MPPKLIIFDLDGTLVDSAPDIATAINRMRSELGYSEKPLAQIQQWVGNGSAMLVKRALGEALQLAPEAVPADLFQQGHELFFRHYRITNGEHTTVFAGVRETLEHFYQCGIQQAICTNKPGEFTDTLLRKLKLAHYFNAVVSGDTLPQKKPDPTPLLFCAKQCNALIHECLMVGDSMTDINAARNAGMNVICVSYGYNRGDDLAKECEVIHSFLEILS